MLGLECDRVAWAALLQMALWWHVHGPRVQGPSLWVLMPVFGAPAAQGFSHPLLLIFSGLHRVVVPLC